MRAVAILEVMRDWRAMTSRAGYEQQAPRWFSINPDNFTGRRLHRWLAHFDEFLVTNACPQLVSSAQGRGVPDKKWLSDNLIALQPFDLLLVCGRVAQETYRKEHAGAARIVEIPHPAARQWTKEGLDLTHSVIKDGETATRVFIKEKVFYNGPIP